MSLLTGPLVFCTDGDPASLAAFPRVAAFADSIGSRVLILHLIGSTARSSDDRLGAMLAALDRDELPGVITVASNDLAAAINGLAESQGGAVALLPTRRRNVSRLLTGNAYERLIRESPLPLLALPDDGLIGAVRRVLFPADLSPRSLVAFDQTVGLCGDLGAELHILHVFGDDRLLPSERDLSRRAAVKNPLELYNIDKESIQNLVDRAAAQGVHAVSRSAEGRAHTQILSYASSNPIDLIAMPTHGPRSLEDIVLGSTTVRVVQQAPLPVLVLRG